MKKKLDTRFPAARIKKIMQTDDDVGKIAMATPVLVSKALELFLQDLCDKTYDVTVSRGAKTLNGAHLKQCVAAYSQFDFLQEVVAKAQDAAPEGGHVDEKGIAARAHQRRSVDDDDDDDGDSSEPEDEISPRAQDLKRQRSIDAALPKVELQDLKRAKKDVRGDGRGRCRSRGRGKGRGASKSYDVGRAYEGKPSNGVIREESRKEDQSSASVGKVEKEIASPPATSARVKIEDQLELLDNKAMVSPKGLLPKGKPRDFDLNMDLNEAPMNTIESLDNGRETITHSRQWQERDKDMERSHVPTDIEVEKETQVEIQINGFRGKSALDTSLVGSGKKMILYEDDDDYDCDEDV